MLPLVDELKAKGEAAIDAWQSDGMGEGLHFDCKLKADPSIFRLSKDDRKNLGKTLSAFANSEGGLLLWGVDAREEQDVDRVVGKQPIAQIAAFKSAVDHAIADLISPPIPGLESFEIASSQMDGSGYLAVVVPGSERRPHMSRNNSDPGFYFRNGHQSVSWKCFRSGIRCFGARFQSWSSNGIFASGMKASLQ